MAKLIAMTRDEKGIPTSHTYEAKDGLRYTGRYAAVVEAAADAHDETRNSALGKLLAARREARISASAASSTDSTP